MRIHLWSPTIYSPLLPLHLFPDLDLSFSLSIISFPERIQIQPLIKLYNNNAVHVREGAVPPLHPGKFKDKSHRHFHRCSSSTSTLFLWALTAAYLTFQPSATSHFSHWESHVRSSAQISRPNGFVGSHVSLALKKCGDGVVGLDNFNHYYDPARKDLLSSHHIFIVDGDINNAKLLAKLFDIAKFTHVMHLAAQAGVRYAMENPHSYIHSNIAGLVTLLEASKSVNPQPSVVSASSSVEDDHKVETMNACKAMLHENEEVCKVSLKSDELDACHVKDARARDLVEDACLQSENGTKDAADVVAGALDHKRSWRDVAIQGDMKKRST